MSLTVTILRSCLYLRRKSLAGRRVKRVEYKAIDAMLAERLQQMEAEDRAFTAADREDVAAYRASEAAVRRQSMMHRHAQLLKGKEIDAMLAQQRKEQEAHSKALREADRAAVLAYEKEQKEKAR